MRLSNCAEVESAVKQAVAVVMQQAEDNGSVLLLMDFTMLNEHTNYTLSAHRLGAIGCKEHKEIQARVERVAAVAKGTPGFRAEKELMETERHRFFSDVGEALLWLKTK